MLATEIHENQDGKFLVLAQDALAGHLRRGDRWEPHITSLIHSLVSPGSIAVDAGAHIGYTSVALANAVGERGAVVACEPLRIIFQLLCANCMLNGLPNVYALNVALGAVDGATIEMAPVNYQTPGNLMDTPVGSGGERVKVRAIDVLGLPHVELIKIDVQGFEREVLRGATRTIALYRPLMLIEVEDFQLRRQGLSAGELLEDVLALNYQCVWIDNDYPVDFVAVPSERAELIDVVRSAISDETVVVQALSDQFLTRMADSFQRKTARFR